MANTWDDKNVSVRMTNYKTFVAPREFEKMEIAEVVYINSSTSKIVFYLICIEIAWANFVSAHQRATPTRISYAQIHAS